MLSFPLVNEIFDQVLHQALDLEPRYVKARKNLAELLLKAGRPEDARAEREKITLLEKTP